MSASGDHVSSLYSYELDKVVKSGQVAVNLWELTPRR